MKMEITILVKSLKKRCQHYEKYNLTYKKTKEKKRQRTRKVIYSNPPFSKSVSTDKTENSFPLNKTIAAGFL